MYMYILFTHMHMYMYLLLQALDWCIESAGVLSEHDILSLDPKNMDVERVKRDFDQFLQNYPPPSDEDLHQLQELTEAIGNTWIKGNAEFAYNRVMEVSAKFQHCNKMLDGMLEYKKRHNHEAARGGRKATGVSDRVVGDGETLPVESDPVFSDSNSIIPNVVSEVQLRSTQKDMGKSLQYDDEMMGLEEALMLLEGAARSASNKLNSTSTDGGEQNKH